MPEAPGFDVAVVGAGPVGLTAALLLAKAGWKVACLERFAEPYGRPRAVGVDFEACRVLQAAGVIDDILAVSDDGIGTYEWHNVRGEKLLVIPFSGTGPSGWPEHLNFSQPQVEAILRSAAAASPDVTLMAGTEVTSLDQDSSGVRIGTGSGSPVRASYVVGCDGANSFVRSRMPDGLTDLGFFYDWLILDVVPHEEREWNPRHLQICDPARPTTVVASGPGQRRWEFMVLPGERVRDMNTEETAWRLLRRWDLGPHNATLERHTVYTFQARWAKTWNSGRLLLAGDAAHLMPPFAGQGLCSGLRDAMNLSWKLDLVLRGVAPSSLLDTYTAERAEHVQHAIQYSVELGKVICVLDPVQAAERDRRMTATGGDPSLALPSLPPASFSSGVVHLDADGGLLAPAGEVAPQFRVATVFGNGLFDDVFGSSFALLSASPLRERLSPANLEFLDRVGCRVVRLLPPGPGDAGSGDAVDVSGGYLGELERLGCTAALIRPDGYYFGVAKAASDADALVSQLRTCILGSGGLVDQ